MNRILRAAVVLSAVSIAGPGVSAKEPPSPKGLDALWTELGTDEPVKAHQAIAAFVAQPTQTVPFLKERLRPIPNPDPHRLTRLIADLGDPQFKVRESATKELDRLGEPAEPALQKALAEGAAPEVRRRMEQLLETRKRQRLHPLPEQRRLARAVEVLESIGDPAARRLLGTLAEGAAEAPLTRDARGAVERLRVLQP